MIARPDNDFIFRNSKVLDQLPFKLKLKMPPGDRGKRCYSGKLVNRTEIQTTNAPLPTGCETSDGGCGASSSDMGGQVASNLPSALSQLRNRPHPRSVASNGSFLS